MAKPKKFTYRIQYVDNTYQIVGWTKAEFEHVGMMLNTDRNMIIVGDEMFRSSHIRAIVYLPPIPEPTKEERQADAEKQLSEWGFVDPDTAQWLKDNGIDIGGGH